MEKYYGYYKSPIGFIKVVASNEYIMYVDFVEEILEEEKLNEIVSKAILQLDEYFIGQRKEFDLKIKLDGTEFQNKCWQELMKIPYGETRSYKEVAEAIENPKSVRAVGGANNKNPIAVIVPCHRVIGKNGKMVGYAGGIDKKVWLLSHEK